MFGNKWRGGVLLRELTTTIKAKTGLHARPAAALVNSIAKFKSQVTIIKEEQEANLKSILGLLSLSVEQHDTVTIRAEGKDEDQVIAALNNCAAEHGLW